MRWIKMSLFFPLKIKEVLKNDYQLLRNTKTDLTKSYISIESRSREMVRLFQVEMVRQKEYTIY